MFSKLLLLFIIVPMLELFLLIELGQLVGTWPTLGLIITTGFLGAYLVRWQGLQALNRIQTEMQQGQLPADSIGDGAIILVAGAFLMTPGILTDTCGFLCLIPTTRRIIKQVVWSRILKAVQNGSIITSATYVGGYQTRVEPDNVIIINQDNSPE